MEIKTCIDFDKLTQTLEFFSGKKKRAPLMEMSGSASGRNQEWTIQRETGNIEDTERGQTKQKAHISHGVLRCRYHINNQSPGCFFYYHFRLHDISSHNQIGP